MKLFDGDLQIRPKRIDFCKLGKNITIGFRRKHMGPAAFLQGTMGFAKQNRGVRQHDLVAFHVNSHVNHAGRFRHALGEHSLPTGKIDPIAGILVRNGRRRSDGGGKRDGGDRQSKRESHGNDFHGRPLKLV